MKESINQESIKSRVQYPGREHADCVTSHECLTVTSSRTPTLPQKREEVQKKNTNDKQGKEAKKDDRERSRVIQVHTKAEIEIE